MTGVVPSRSLCELGPCLVGVWVRGRVAGCCSACFAARCYCVNAGWGETEVFMDVSSWRLAPVQHRHLSARGLLSLFSLLRAFLLTVIKRNQAQWRKSGCGSLPFLCELKHATWVVSFLFKKTKNRNRAFLTVELLLRLG